MSLVVDDLFETKKELDENLILPSVKDESGPEEIESSDYFFNSDLALKNENNFSNSIFVEVISDVLPETDDYKEGKISFNDNYESVEEKPSSHNSSNYFVKSDCAAIVNLVPQLKVNLDSESKNSGQSKSVSLELNENSIKSEWDSSPKSNSVYNCIYCDECFISQSFLYLHVAEKHGICFDDENVPERTHEIESNNSNQEWRVIGDDKQPESTSFSNDVGKRGKKSVKKKKNSTKKVRHVCQVCNKTYSCLYSLTRHKIVHSKHPATPSKHPAIPSKLLQCSICSAEFKTKEGYYIHYINIHQQVPVELADEYDEQMLHQCPFCPSKFFQRYIETHIASHENERLHKCTVCSKKFNVKSELKQHMSIHENKHVCKICKKSCRTNSKLKEHMMVHDGQRPHKCPHCPSSYKRSNALKQHVLVNHENEIIHKSSFCEKSFVRVSALTQHLTIHERKKHENGKRFNCSLCSKSYKYKSDLKKHLKLHDPEHKRTHLSSELGIKQTQIHKFECYHCKLKYKTKGELTKHIISKHDGKAHKGIQKNSIVESIARYECDDCNKRFFLKSKLAEHMKKKT